ncbi:MAG TPA: glycine cleavage system protein H, partial [Kofleriaceae bacterium]|nr:glycine cleavage system protein H [Kofleriaceae bacterium]
LFAPVSGTVVKVNTPLHDTPEAVNEEPYDEGWMIEIEMSEPSQADELMTVEQYTAFLAEQE